MINELSKQIHENAKAKGFFDEEKNIGEMLMLIVIEVSEACECDRNEKYANDQMKHNEFLSNESSDENFNAYFAGNVKDTFEDELADIMIRVMDLAAFKNIDLEAHIKAKMRYNSMRPHKHGKKY